MEQQQYGAHVHTREEGREDETGRQEEDRRWVDWSGACEREDEMR